MPDLMHLHILGLCGTFMGGVAALARAAGHTVTGADAGVYPPMSTQLDALGVRVFDGWDPAQFEPQPDLVLIGNALSRGNPAVEHVLERGLRYTSAPQWLADHFLADRWVLAVAGTHGKTTTTALLAWVLECAGLKPGFLVGGVPRDFDASARAGDAPFFVIEADEYDTAFFDKRSKFVHYRARTLVLNNLEYDHADIFPDLAAIERQFHHVVRTVPGNGLIVANGVDANLERVLAQGCWTPVERFGIAGGWSAELDADDGSAFRVLLDGREQATVRWRHHGLHMVSNALATFAAARHAGVAPAVTADALARFGGVKRRMELRGRVGGVSVWDDFAHHPTAIATTLDGLRRSVGDARIVAVVDPRSNTMRAGVHRDTLAASLSAADRVVLHAPPEFRWDAAGALAPLGARASTAPDPDAIVALLVPELRAGDHVLVMSNGGFGGLHAKLLAALGATA